MSSDETGSPSATRVAHERQPAGGEHPHPARHPGQHAHGQRPRRKILFCTIGETPQVVTETVWALMQQPRYWIPDEIHIVTTTFALPRIRGALQDREGKLAALLGERFPPVTVHVPQRNGPPLVFAAPDGRAGPHSEGGAGGDVAAGQDALYDVNTERDATLMGDLILQLMAGFVRDDDSEVHVSLAGGRKTMSAHALLAVTLVARSRDKASHVLVSPEFEGHRDFPQFLSFLHEDSRRVARASGPSQLLPAHEVTQCILADWEHRSVGGVNAQRPPT